MSLPIHPAVGAMFANESRRRTDPNPTETDHLGNVYTKSDVFVYRPLDPTVDCTRFVAIEPADDEDSPVVCRLVHLPFGQRPKFEALSYTWGDDNPNNAITVDGCKFEVRSNLLDALRFLRRQVSQDALFWIDALCINQKDADERNRQLRMMGQIYFRVSQVIVWLGRKYSKFQETIERISAESPTANDEETEQDISERTQNKIKDVESALLAKLVSDDYWDRLWIIQEIGQNDEKKVCFGTTSMSWENFIHTVTHHSHFNGEGPLRLDRHLKEKYTGSHTLRRLLVEHRLAKCKDRKDKVYGLVVLAADGHGFPMDYRKSLMEIWTDTMRFMNARQLFHPTSESDIMDMGRLIKSLLMEPHSSPLQQVGRLYEAKTDPKLIIERDHVSNNADVFPVKSYVLGSIVHVGPPARDMVSNIGKANEWAESVQHNFSSDLGEAYEESCKILRAILASDDATLAGKCFDHLGLVKWTAMPFKYRNWDGYRFSSTGRLQDHYKTPNPDCDETAELHVDADKIRAPGAGSVNKQDGVADVYLYQLEDNTSRSQPWKMGIVSAQARRGDLICWIRETSRAVVVRMYQGESQYVTSSLQVCGTAVVGEDVRESQPNHVDRCQTVWNNTTLKLDPATIFVLID